MACVYASFTPVRRKAMLLVFLCVYAFVLGFFFLRFFFLKGTKKWDIRQSNPNTKQIPSQITFSSRGFCFSFKGGKNINLVYFDKDSCSNFLSWIYHYYKYYSQFSYFSHFLHRPSLYIRENSCRKLKKYNIIYIKL